MSIPRGPLHQGVTIAREFTDSRHPTVSRSVEPSALPLKWSRMRWRSVLMLGFTVWPFCLLGRDADIKQYVTKRLMAPLHWNVR